MAHANSDTRPDVGERYVDTLHPSEIHQHQNVGTRMMRKENRDVETRNTRRIAEIVDEEVVRSIVVDVATTTVAPAEKAAEKDDAEAPLDVLSGKLLLNVSDTREFISNGEAQADVTKIIANFADVTEDSVFDEFHAKPKGVVEINFRITVPKNEDINQIAGLITGTNTANKTKMEEALASAFEENKLPKKVNVIQFSSTFDEPPTPDVGVAKGVEVAGGSPTTAAPPSGDNPIPKEARLRRRVTFASKPDGAFVFGRTTTDPQQTATMTTTFVPQDEIDGEVEIHVADQQAFLISVDLQKSVCGSLAFAAGLNNTNDMFCTFKLFANVGDADDKAVADLRHKARTLQRIGGNSRVAVTGGLTVLFKIDVRHISINRTLDALKQINVTDVVLNVREEVEDKGFKLPDMEITTLFVDGVALDIASPPAPLRMPFGDNVTKWTPAQAAVGGPPITPSPWIMPTTTVGSATAPLPGKIDIKVNETTGEAETATAAPVGPPAVAPAAPGAPLAPSAPAAPPTPSAAPAPAAPAPGAPPAPAAPGVPAAAGAPPATAAPGATPAPAAPGAPTSPATTAAPAATGAAIATTAAAATTVAATTAADATTTTVPGATTTTLAGATTTTVAAPSSTTSSIPGRADRMASLGFMPAGLVTVIAALL